MFSIQFNNKKTLFNNFSVCTDKMSNHLNDEQVKVSSSKEPISALKISVYKDEGWVPMTNDPNQWLQVSINYPLLLLLNMNLLTTPLIKPEYV